MFMAMTWLEISKMHWRSMSNLVMQQQLSEKKMKYKVKLVFKYSDIVHVEAESEKEAIEKAFHDCNEQYECFFDVSVSDDDE